MFRRNKEQGEDSGDGLGLETLSPPPDAGDRDAIVDIVFVHGLGGKRHHTWTKDGVLWPRDLLAKDFTRARIMTWGYDANIIKFFGPTGQSNIRDHAKALNFDLCHARREDHQIARPIIFVAHSLGGLVVKKALFNSYLEAVKQNTGAIDQGLPALYASTKGILFAGTPHRGSNAAKWPTRLAWLVQSDRKAELISTLRQGSQQLDDIQQHFKQILENFAVYSLLEEVPYPRIGKIVEQDSALIGWHETEVLIHANHRDMVKFASETDNNYKKVRNIIGDIISNRIDGAVTEGNAAVGSGRITRSRTWCPSGDRRAPDAPPSTEQPLERSTTIGAIPQSTQTTHTSSSEEDFASALKQGEYYFRQLNRNDPNNLVAAYQSFTRAYSLMKKSTGPNHAALVEILLEMVNVRTEMSYQRCLSPQDKMTCVNDAIMFCEKARTYALSSPVIGHLALVQLNQAILLGREAEVDGKLGETAVEVRRKKAEALQGISTSLGALRDSGQQDTDRYRKWADDWRVRLTKT